MDRFIEARRPLMRNYKKFKIQYGQIYRLKDTNTKQEFNIDLKSNMDRFIVTPQQAIADAIKHLKSNMDRFIVLLCLCCDLIITYLKSNMDRFIA